MTTRPTRPPGRGLRRLLPLALVVPAAALAVPAAAQDSGVPTAGAPTAAAAQDTGAPTAAAEPEQVLVFSRTTGFRHTSIEVGVLAVESLGQENGFDVEATEDPSVFTDDGLADVDAVVFLNTTGDVLDDAQRAALERYVRGGGGWVGVHSAADSEYTSDFHTELLGGARFLAHPIQQPGLLRRESADHPSTAHLGEEWFIPFEEYYSFTDTPRPRTRVLLTIDEDSYAQDPNTSNLPESPTFPEGVSGVMGDHPMAWCLDVDEGRSWYTALGHEAALYLTPEYRQHLLGGILTAAGRLDADCSVQAAAPAPARTASGATPTAPPGAAPTALSASGPRLPATGGGAAVVPLLVLALAAALRRRDAR
jgi:uncharacterized protein